MLCIGGALLVFKKSNSDLLGIHEKIYSVEKF